MFGRGYRNFYGTTTGAPRYNAPMFQGNVAYQNANVMYPQGFPVFQGPQGQYNSAFATPFANYGVAPSAVPTAQFAPIGPVADYGVVADPAWYIDSGATNHVTKEAGIFSSYSIYHGFDKLHVGNGMGLHIKHVGCTRLTTLAATSIYLNHILHVPAITKNLLSVSKLLADNDVVVEFYKTFCFVKDKNSGIILLKGIARGGLYQVECPVAVSYAAVSSRVQPNVFCVSSNFSSVSNGCSSPVSMISHSNVSNSINSGETLPAVNISQFNNEASMALSVTHSNSVDYNVLHKRMGHPTVHALKQIVKHLHPSLDINRTLKPILSNACQFGKCYMQHFPFIDTTTIQPLELLHADLWGPAPLLSSQGYHYYLSILDDFTRFTWIFPLVTKSQALQTFIEFQHMIEKCLSRKIKCLQTDWGGEFRQFLPYLAEQGIQFRHPYPYIHHQNGKIERKHRHMVETGLTLLAQAHLPLKIWWNAFHTATCLINKLPTPILDNKSPFEKLFHKRPDYSVMRVFGCACFPYLRPYNHHKLEFRTARCIFSWVQLPSQRLLVSSFL